MNTQTKTTKKASAPETRTYQGGIWSDAHCNDFTQSKRTLPMEKPEDITRSTLCQFDWSSTDPVDVENARLIVASVNHANALAEALRHSADKLNDLGEWLKAYAEPKQALSVKAIENEAREVLANWEGAK